ncbi:P-type ATPase, cytoplasmic N domain-containing protein [Rozella allomycis CSF55]|uniref:Phospholipid-transporting ATPase n=1 Tax=Rozella allomycis (strain CSF55) TaxID=988480 RepID=A0A075AYZ4_ROZAC|nr:P-type ATPase, cytoplasmic N domain-containing protein [Rozella allomycis CSF55]|eukprot:EPZ33774.1 P-type ATPase, cytoplasmic N domain-containing protein [Rozella allomycis CSF55]
MNKLYKLFKRSLPHERLGSNSASEAESMNFRQIMISSPNDGYLSNAISTTKYTLLTFLPKFLSEQFSKYANVFFLVTSVIQQIDGVSPTNKYSTLLPLVFVLSASGLKEAVEDWKRRKSDMEVNERVVKVLVGGRFEERMWVQVRVGDIVRVENGEYFPADLVLLSSSEPDALCYIETANLDGETNLKIRQGKSETAEMLTPESVSLLRGRYDLWLMKGCVLKSEMPNSSLYTFEGTLRVGEKEIPLEPSQMLLRGAALRNTRWVYGVVVFTGHDSKLMRNAHAAPIKQTNIEKMTNSQIFFLFLILIILSIVSSMAHVGFVVGDEKRHWYLSGESSSSFVYTFLTFVVLYNNLIPISLIVTMEVVRVVQAMLISSDLDMYYEEADQCAVARTSSLVEELGQVEYIFSDKTGTLTCNKMVLKRCMIGGINYIDELEEGMIRANVNRRDEDGYEIGYYLFEDIMKNVNMHASRDTIKEYMKLLSVCHTVIPERGDDGEIVYQAASPDEGALVNGASLIGYKFVVRRPKSVTVRVMNEEMEFEILNVLEFNSDRKRMSVIVKEGDKIKLYCKGADTVIFERLKEGDREGLREGDSKVTTANTPTGNSPTGNLKEKVLSQLEDCASLGLRTLCLAMREIEEEEYLEWKKIYDAASLTIKNRTEEIDKACEMIEKDLRLLGATAIEDKLQDQVPETINVLSMAGIKIWVLTGDRQETAINIGYSCKLLNEEINLIIINENTHFETRDCLMNKLNSINEAMKIAKQSNSEIESFALIIDGKSLSFALEKDLEEMFFNLAKLCKSVICCRVSPIQKALVVKLVKRNTNSILLAIGDGANDVSMIQAAHVGVGISGLEGLQASRSSDFSISQFKYLQKLLLVHGGWCYRRLSRLILYSFYKNITLYLTQFWFAFYNTFSGQTLYESWTLTLYNMFFTVLPPLVIGIFDQYLGARQLDNYPQLYQSGIQKSFFNVKVFWTWTFNAIIHSLTLFLFLFYLGFNEIILSTGSSAGLWFLGLIIYTSEIITVLYKAALLIDYYTIYAVAAFIGSFLFYFLFISIYSYLGPVFNVGYETYIPTCYHIVQEFQKYNIPDYRPRMDRFMKAVHKVRLLQRIKRNRGYAFSQTEDGQASLIRKYDTTKEKPKGL